MPMIDERGRVFGRLNLVDAAVGVLLLVLMPAAYASYALFKDPPPRLTAVLPTVLSPAAGQQVEIRGEHFRPYMRVSFDGVQGRTFLFYSTGSAFVQLPDLAPGTYDVVLYDYMQEVARLPKAVTIQPPPPPPTIFVEVNGVLTSMTPNLVERLQFVSRFPEAGPTIAELQTKGAAEPEMWHIKTGNTSALTVPGSGLLQVPVRMRLRCVVETDADGTRRCTVNGTPVMTAANVRLPGLGTTLNLRVNDVTDAKR
jgi:hypothetical protein